MISGLNGSTELDYLNWREKGEGGGGNGVIWGKKRGNNVTRMQSIKEHTLFPGIQLSKMTSSLMAVNCLFPLARCPSQQKLLITLIRILERDPAFWNVILKILLKLYVTLIAFVNINKCPPG